MFLHGFPLISLTVCHSSSVPAKEMGDLVSEKEALPSSAQKQVDLLKYEPNNLQNSVRVLVTQRRYS